MDVESPSPTIPLFKFARDPAAAMKAADHGPLLVHRVGQPLFYALSPELHDALMAEIEELIDDRAVLLATLKGAETIEVDIDDL